MTGPLDGVHIVEIAGAGPGPFAAMMLADMGATVTTVDRCEDAPVHDPTEPHPDLLRRGRRSISLDLKSSAGVDVALRLIERSDALIEGFRPGVMERLGLGPSVCLARNKKLVYGRMTGWGQDGPMASAAGHDINYIALSGALGQIRPAGGAPVPPLNLLGDFGGGGMHLAFGIACGILSAMRTGAGQVVDAAMVDGVSSLLTLFWGQAREGIYEPERPGANLLDGGAPFYNVYECSDGRFISIGALEPKFFGNLISVLGLVDQVSAADQNDRSVWPRLEELFTTRFRAKSRQDWCVLFEGADACFAPVLSLNEVPTNSHIAERVTVAEHAGVMQPAPAPRFSRTVATLERVPAHPGQHTHEVLSELGYTAAEISTMLANGYATILELGTQETEISR